MKSIKIIFSSVLFLTLFSCKKLIEIEETDFIGGDIALATISNNEQAVIGAYGGLGIEMDILMNATFSDELRRGEFYNAATTHEWQYSSTDIGLRDNFTAITPLYRTIDRVNRVLQVLPTADSLKTTDTEALRVRTKGEALFLRAFCHFQLFRFYLGNYDPAGAGLPYMETPSLSPQGRIAMGPYFQKMNADIAEAKGLLPNNLTDVARATRAAASGLQARIALYMRDWANAITYSTEYINALPLSSRAAFSGIWTEANNNEIAFELRRTATQGGRIGSLFRGVSATASPTGIATVTWFPSEELWNSYDQTNDIRFSAYFRNEPALGAQNPPRNTKLISKYAGTGYGTAAENVADAKVFRTGEMYLIRAEARAESGDLVGAAADINALRTARITGYTNVTFASKDAAIAEIIQERFKELAYEGHRFWDLKRRGLPVTRTGLDVPSAVGTTLPANDFRFLLPIPNTEILANPLIGQNPGYTN